MRTIRFLLYWGILLVKLVESIDTYINFTQSFTFSSKIKRARSHTLSSEFIYILYEDNNIAKYYNNLTLVKKFSAGTKILKDIDVFDKVAFLTGYSIYGLIQGSGNQFVLINQATNAKTYFTKYSDVRFIFVCYSSFAIFPVYSALFFYQDSFLKFTEGRNYEENQYNFSSTTPGYRNYPQQIIDANYNGKLYKIMRTTQKQIYVIRLIYNSTVGYCVQAIQMLYDFKNVNTNPVISFQVDKNQVIVLQFSDYSLFAVHMLTTWVHTFDSNLTTLVGASTLKKIRPINPNDGQRVFIFDNKSIRVRLNSSSIYSFLTLQQTNYQIGSGKVDILVLSSTYSFLTQQNTTLIYGYCETLTVNTLLSSCITSIYCTISNCITCNIARTICSACQSGYYLLNNKCYLLRTCSVSNCFLCQLNQTCVICDNLYALDSSNNTCLYDGLTNNTNTPNITINITDPQQEVPEITNITNTTDTNENQTIFYDGIDFNNIDQEDLITQLYNRFDPTIKRLNSALKSINGFSGSRTIFRFLSPLFQFFDDYWYYIYHQDSYPQADMVQFFLVFMKTVNEERIIGSYFSYDNPINLKSIVTSNYQIYTIKRILFIDKMQTYLGQSLHDIVFNQYIILIFMFSIAKIISLVFRSFILKEKQQLAFNQNKRKVLRYEQKQKLSNRGEEQIIQSKNIQAQDKQKYNSPRLSNQQNRSEKSILKSIYEYLENFCSLKNILLSFLGSNMIFFSFQLSSQFRILFSFNPVDMWNVAITYSLGGILMLFTILIYLYEQIFPKKSAKNRNSDKQQKIQSYYLTYFSHIKNIAFGFIHGFFIQHITMQYVLLISVKIFLIIIILKKQQLIDKIILKVLMLVYFSVGICIDLLCLSSNKQLFPPIFMEYVTNDFNILNLIEIVFLSILSLAVLLQVVVQTFYSLSSVTCSKNKVNMPQQAVQHPKSIFSMFNKIIPQGLKNSKVNFKQTHLLKQQNGMTSNDNLNNINSQSIQYHLNQSIIINKLQKKLKLSYKNKVTINQPTHGAKQLQGQEDANKNRRKLKLKYSHKKIPQKLNINANDRNNTNFTEQQQTLEQQYYKTIGNHDQNSQVFKRQNPFNSSQIDINSIGLMQKQKEKIITYHKKMMKFTKKIKTQKMEKQITSNNQSLYQPQSHQTSINDIELIENSLAGSQKNKTGSHLSNNRKQQDLVQQQEQEYDVQIKKHVRVRRRLKQKKDNQKR